MFVILFMFVIKIVCNLHLTQSFLAIMEKSGHLTASGKSKQIETKNIHKNRVICSGFGKLCGTCLVNDQLSLPGRPTVITACMSTGHHYLADGSSLRLH